MILFCDYTPCAHVSLLVVGGGALLDFNSSAYCGMNESE